MTPAAWIEMLQRLEPDLNICCMYESKVSGLFNVPPRTDAVIVSDDPIKIGEARICVKNFPPEDYIPRKNDESPTGHVDATPNRQTHGGVSQ